MAAKREKTLAENSGSEPARRGRGYGRPFPKGQSPNPGGRPREERELVEALRLRGVDLANKLIELALKGNVKAIEVALSRAYGKPRERVELTGADGGPVKMDLTRLSDEELSTLERIVRKGTGAEVPDA